MEPFVPAARFILLYDQHCPLCLRSIAFLGHRKGAEMLQAVPLQTPGILDRFGICREDAMREIQVIDRQGKVFPGAEGIFRAMAILPRWRWVGALLEVPGVLPAARPIYRFIASRRARRVCQDGSCHLP